MIELEKLKNIPIFNKFDKKSLELLHNMSKIKLLRDGAVLFYEGEDSDNLHILLDGKIEVYKSDAKAKKIVLTHFTPFSFIAEVSNYNNIKFPATSKSIGNSEVLVIDYKKFEEHFLYHPLIAPVIIKSMSAKIMNLEKIIFSNIVLNATQRVASFLCENENILNTHKHTDIADRLNITPVSLSRILKKFKKSESITQQKEGKFIINKESLLTHVNANN
ncbi:MAG: Crp/Fnr family transcriptional regulator [Campylobacterota bacterium]|nr:Crp/Fnr family transcriptional regulator [Campylobacterota bacterium]